MPESMRCLPFRSEPGGGDRDAKFAELARGIVTGGQDGAAGLGSGVLVATRARPAPRPGAPSNSPSGKPSPTLREPRAALANSPFTAHRELTSSHLGAKSK